MFQWHAVFGFSSNYNLKNLENPLMSRMFDKTPELPRHARVRDGEIRQNIIL